MRLPGLGPKTSHEQRRRVYDSVVALSKGSGDPPVVRLYEWAHRRFPASIDCRPIHVMSAVAAAGFDTPQHRTKGLFGLPVAVVLARKPTPSSP